MLIDNLTKEFDINAMKLFETKYVISSYGEIFFANDTPTLFLNPTIALITFL